LILKEICLSAISYKLNILVDRFSCNCNTWMG